MSALLPDFWSCLPHLEMLSPFGMAYLARQSFAATLVSLALLIAFCLAMLVPLSPNILALLTILGSCPYNVPDRFHIHHLPSCSSFLIANPPSLWLLASVNKNLVSLVPSSLAAVTLLERGMLSLPTLVLLSLTHTYHYSLNYSGTLCPGVVPF